MIRLDETDTGEILRYLGYRGSELTQRISDDLSACIDIANEIIRPRATWKAFSFYYYEKGVGLEGTDCVLAGKSLVKHLNGAGRGVLLCVTLGRDFDEEVNRLMVKDPGKGVILNSCGIQAVEKLADALQREIDARLSEGSEDCDYYTGPRFSPGYGDLPLESQTDFISLLRAEKTVGVRLNSNYLMNPTKSVTAICGIYKKEKQ